MKWGPFDETIISIHEEGIFCVWNIETQAKLMVVDGHEGPISGLQFNADRTLMITCSRDKTVKLWETEVRLLSAGYWVILPFISKSVSLRFTFTFYCSTYPLKSIISNTPT